MVNIGDNNEFSYLRNRNFSSTIVLELKQTDTGRCQCVGVVFDVETATNEIGRLFFWHEGPLWENAYRTDGRTMTTEEVKDYLQGHYGKEDFYCGSHNERFRKQLYDIYLGGLDSEKFPLLFKRAIPFRMNIKLEDFVKEYICMEQDIHIEDMQESVLQYGRMQKKIMDTREEIGELTKLTDLYRGLEGRRREEIKQEYFYRRLELLRQNEEVGELQDKALLDEAELEKKRQLLASLEQNIKDLTAQSEALLRQIMESGYEGLKTQLESVNGLVERLSTSRGYFQKTVEKLKAWKDEDVTYNSVIWTIEELEKGKADEGGLRKLKRDLQEIREEIQEQIQDAKNKLRELRKEQKQAAEELARLKQGERAYPAEVEQARAYLLRRLAEQTGKQVPVEVLADLLDIRDERWRNAVEGYLGGNKLSLIVEPRYAKLAMELYRELDAKQFYSVAVLDTERVDQEEHTVLENALAGEVTASRSYIKSYINFQLGRVVKCETVEELRRCRIGITADCVLYHSYRIQHINPNQYTRMAYIGKSSVKRRMTLLREQLDAIEKKMAPQEDIVKQGGRILELEPLSSPVEVYLGWFKDMEELKKTQKEKARLEQKIEELKTRDVDQWEQERRAIDGICDGKKAEYKEQERNIWKLEEQIKQSREAAVTGQERVLQLKDTLNAWMVARKGGAPVSDTAGNEAPGEITPSFFDICEHELQEFISSQKTARTARLLERCQTALEGAAEESRKAKDTLVSARSEYLRCYVNRSNLPVTGEDNRKYEELLERLSCDRLEEYQKIASEQAQAAVEHFRDDFMYKIRDAIREAIERKDELNRVISRLDFGKDKYRFVIGRNKGAFGPYYDMFMDKNLEINPSQLNNNMDYQMNMFSMEHENHYGEQMNELISVFIPPENATQEQLEEARRNMEKFADYRTYLSFDMEQIIENEEGTMKIGLSRMIRKNSGGEGQNPLYVALLASFAQAYRINLTPKLQRRPTIRLVVLDEAFSKMDSEKVASCIELIRGLGFQALISATNDKIQNYLENVDKTFVFANPSKKCISIQEFEKTEFKELSAGMEEA